ncbi:hypothetical protein PG993_014161 [Apiospora rasikravindrae]|uniref:Uncharacterized protein n=1 Tax=Apiospora rasikravindrae TaxID=990691 RepID=A0ABR1RS94_9PEZI
MKTKTSPLRLLPYLGLALLIDEVTAQDVSSSSSSLYQSSSAASPPPPPPPAPSTTSSLVPDVETSVVYTTVTSYVVDPGAAQPSSSTSSAYSSTDEVPGAAASTSLTTTVTVDSYLLTTSTSTFITSYYNATTTTTTTSSSSSTIYYTPPTSTPTPSPSSSPSSSWDSSQYTQYTSHDHGPLPSTTTVFALPSSTDASEYLHHVFPPTAAQPTWATGSFYTQLASALYAVDRSFAGRTDYATIVAAISQAGDEDSPQVSESIAKSAWGWAAVTTNGWYQSDVPAPVKTDVAQYVDAWHNAEFSVLDDAQKAEATATGKGGNGGSGSGSGGGKGGGGSGISSSESAPSPGKDGLRMMVGVVAGLLVGVVGLL